MNNPTDIKSEFIKAAAATLTSIGLSEDFFHGLLDQGNDWTFIIKSHALLESAITHLIVADLNRSELSSIVSYLEMSNTRIGKVAFAKCLGLLTKDHRSFIRDLSELRNQLVHEIQNTNFTFKNHSIGIGKIVKKCIKTSSLMLNNEFEIAGKRVSREQFSTENPRLTIWFAIYSILYSIYSVVGIEDPLLRTLIKIERRRQIANGK